jgi:hypothetical protein
MRKLLPIILLLLSGHLIQAAEQRLSNGVIVSDEVPAPKITLDADPNKMTASEFAEYAKKYNANQFAAAKKRHAKYLKDRGSLQTQDRWESSSSSTTRVGGGYGLGGFGGAGGYLGNDTNIDGLSGGNSYFNGSDAGASKGNTIRTESSSSGSSYTHTFPDLNDTGGGPVTVINPFCHDYWKKNWNK